MKRKNKKSLIICMLICMVSLTACSQNVEKQENNIVQSETGTNDNQTAQDNSNQEVSEDSAGSTQSTNTSMQNITYADSDYYEEYDKNAVNYIELMGETINFSGSGAFVQNNVITINSAGTYVVNGTLEDGQIIVNESAGGEVRIILNDAKIHCSTSAPIYVKSAGKVILSLAEGTTNMITDGTSYTYSDVTKEEPSAAIFSKDDLTINGEGSLTVNANFNDGITCKDQLIIMGGNITVNAADDGIVGKDAVIIKEGTFTITAAGDGFKASNDSDATKGFVVIENGTFTIDAGNDAIQAETDAEILNGTFTITTGGGSKEASQKTESNGFGMSSSSSTTEDTTESAKGIKSGSSIILYDGTFVMDTKDDAIHTNGDLTIYNGTYDIASGDDGVHADSTLLIIDGEINILKSYEGLEASNITISGGTIHVTAEDDGVNVAGGNDSSSVSGRPGQNSFSSSSNNKLLIEGGYLYVNAAGDGLDANGSIQISGGTVLVDGPEDGANGALDYDGTFEMTGGILVAAGSSGMAQGLSQATNVSSLKLTFPSTLEAGTVVQVTDEDGNHVIAYAPEKKFQTIVIATSALESDGTYLIYTGSEITGEDTEGLYTADMVKTYQAGTLAATITMDGSITSWSEGGSGSSFHGGGGGGGKGNRR